MKKLTEEDTLRDVAASQAKKIDELERKLIDVSNELLLLKRKLIKLEGLK